jgi:hypothetical protein
MARLGLDLDRQLFKLKDWPFARAISIWSKGHATKTGRDAIKTDF